MVSNVDCDNTPATVLRNDSSAQDSLDPQSMDRGSVQSLCNRRKPPGHNDDAGIAYLALR